MAVGAMHLAKKQAIVSRLVAIEELAGVDVLCSDKTGTLTQNRMTVSDPVPCGDHSLKDLMVYGALASREENQDPIELPIFAFLQKEGWTSELQHYQQKDFKPFDPVGKRTEATVDSPTGTILITKGAPQVIIELCGGPVVCGSFAGTVEELAATGYRTLGVAWKKPEDQQFQFMGLIPFYDPPREDSQATIDQAKKLGLEIKMVTGDNIAIAKQIAGILGIGENIFDARDLRGASTKELVLLGEVIARAVYQKLSPAFRLRRPSSLPRASSKIWKIPLNRSRCPRGMLRPMNQRLSNSSKRPTALPRSFRKTNTSSLTGSKRRIILWA